MYKQAFELIKNSQNITLLSHIDPDADALGSALSMYPILKKLGKGVSVVNYTKEIDKSLDFLPNFSKIKHQLPKKIDLAITFDTGSLDRVGFELDNIKVLNIDHHRSNPRYGDLNLVEDSFPSTSAVVFKLLEENGVVIDKDVATCIYTALVSDTGFFKFEETKEDTFILASKLVRAGVEPSYVAKMLTQRESLAKIRLTSLIYDTLDLKLNAKVAMVKLTKEMLDITGARVSDSEDIANSIRALATVEVAIFLKEREGGVIKVSLRSKNHVDVSKIALSFGGGGHRRASGFTYNSLDFDAVYEEILEKLREIV